MAHVSVGIWAKLSGSHEVFVSPLGNEVLRSGTALTDWLVESVQGVEDLA